MPMSREDIAFGGCPGDAIAQGARREASVQLRCLLDRLACEFEANNAVVSLNFVPTQNFFGGRAITRASIPPPASAVPHQSAPRILELSPIDLTSILFPPPGRLALVTHASQRHIARHALWAPHTNSGPRGTLSPVHRSPLDKRGRCHCQYLIQEACRAERLRNQCHAYLLHRLHRRRTARVPCRRRG